MKIKPLALKQEYKSVIFSGCSIESKHASICNLNDFLTGAYSGRARYQVWSDTHKAYEIHYNIDDAVDRFLELNNKGY